MSNNAKGVLVAGWFTLGGTIVRFIASLLDNDESTAKGFVVGGILGVAIGGVADGNSAEHQQPWEFFNYGVDVMKLRPRFSVRTLAIVVTLVCVYFGAWEATKNYGIPQMHGKTLDNYRILSANSPGPLLISCYREGPIDLPDGYTYAGAISVIRTKYVWLFGPVVRLPLETTIESPIYNADGDSLVTLLPS